MSTGDTLWAYVKELLATGLCLSVTAVAWDTKRPPAFVQLGASEGSESAGQKAAGTNAGTNATAVEAPHGGVGGASKFSEGRWAGVAPAFQGPWLLPVLVGEDRCVRLFVYGSEKARRRVRAVVKRGWDPENDWFAA